MRLLRRRKALRYCPLDGKPLVEVPAENAYPVLLACRDGHKWLWSLTGEAPEAPDRREILAQASPRAVTYHACWKECGPQ